MKSVHFPRPALFPTPESCRNRRPALWRRRCSFEPLENRFLLANWSGTLPDGTVWGATPGEVEVVTGNVDVPAGSTLTIQPGAIIKVQGGTTRLSVAGTVSAMGTATDPIYVTSIHDDTVGGDTNGNGSATSPAAGNWNGVVLTAATADVEFTHVNVRYAGFITPIIQVDAGQLALDHVELRDANRTALQFNSGATGTYNLSDVTISNIGNQVSHHGVFVNSTMATVTATNLSINNIRGTHVIANNAGRWDSTGSILTGTGVKAIAFPGGTITDARAWDDTAVYHLTGAITVAAGASLDIPAGQVVKASGVGQLVVQGMLDVSGTAADPVIFTSFMDDSAGGDTNGDGAATMPAAANWQNVSLGGPDTTARIDYAEIRYGGFLSRPPVDMNDGTLMFTNSLVRDSSTTGIRINPNADSVDLSRTTVRDVAGIGVLVATTSNAPVNMTNLTVENVTGVGVQMDAQSNVDLTGATFNNTARDGAVVVTPGTAVTSTRSWAGHTYMFGTGASGLTITTTGDLTIDAGAVLKFGSARGLANDGKVSALGTPESPVIFTSMRDDTGGDTNQDGNATTPFAGDWFSYWHRDTQNVMADTAQSILQNVELRYAGVEPGSIPTPAVLIDGGTFTASNLLIRDALDAGLRSRFSRQAVVTATNLTIRGTGAEALSFGITSPGGGNVTLDGVHLEDIFGDSVRIHPEFLSLGISNLTMTNINGLRGERIVAGSSPSAVRKTLILGHTGLVVVENRLEVESGGSLSFLPGSIVKIVPRTSALQAARAIVAKNGPIVVAATGASPVVFTSFRDDARGSDTNDDGATTMPAAGDWSGIELRAAGSSLSHVDIHYAGETGQALLIDFPASPSPARGDEDDGVPPPAGSDHNDAPIIETDSLRFSNADVYAFIRVSGADSREVHVSNSSFDNPGSTAVKADGNIRLLTLYNNTFRGGQLGLLLQRLAGGAGGTDETYGEFVNNIFTDQTQAAIKVDAVQNVELDLRHNIFPITALQLVDVNATAVVEQDVNNVTADAMLQDPANGNLTPAPGSPAIDSGQSGEHVPLTDNEGKARHNDTATPNTGTGAMAYIDIGAFEYWNAISGVQLVPTQIDFVDNGDGTVTITTTVFNQGTQSTTEVANQWTDKYFLVQQPEQRGSILANLGDVLRVDLVAPGQQVSFDDTFALPPLPTGTYVVRVQTDVNNELRQDPAITTAADATIPLNYTNPVLPQNGSVDGQIGGGAARSYDFVVPPGCALRIQFEGNNPRMTLGVTQPSVGDIPLPTSDVLGTIVGPGGSVTIANPFEDPYNGLAALQGGLLGDMFRITTEVIKNELTSVTPTIVGNTVTVTFNISGGPFDNTKFSLISPGGAEVPATETREFADGGTAAVTFPGGLQAGAYSLRAAFKGAPGTFAEPQAAATIAGDVKSVVAADFTGDGFPDLVLAGDDMFSISSNDQTGDFDPPATIAQDPTGFDLVDAGDFNGDGRLDIVSVSNNGDTISVHINLGGGFFAPPMDVTTSAGVVVGTATGDFDGDGISDVAVAGNTGVSWFNFQGGSQNVLDGTATGITSIVVGNFGGDGRSAIVYTTNGGQQVWFLRNQGAGVFGPPLNITTNAGGVVGLAVGDLNGDGISDVAARGNFGLTWYNIQNASQQIIDGGAAGITAARVTDFNLDGFPDIAVARNNAISVYNGTGGGNFAPAVTAVPNTGDVPAIVTADIDRDGRDDLGFLSDRMGEDTFSFSNNSDPVVSNMDDAVTVESGGQANVQVTLSGPDGVRAGVANLYTINWQNTGTVDATTNLISVNLPMGLKASLTPNGNPLPQNLLLYSFVPNSTSNLNVPPGASGSMNVYLTSDVGVTQFDVGLNSIPIDDPQLSAIAPFWDDFLDASQLLPPGADPARFDQMADEIADFLGETLGSGLMKLAENAKLDLAGETEPGSKTDLELRRLSIAAGAVLISVPAANVFTQFYPTPMPGPAADGMHQDFVIVVAIEDYSNRRTVDGAGTTDLADTQNDLRHLLDFYQRDLRIGEKQITVLRDLPGRTDDDMTFAKIQQAWKDTVAKADADDKIKFHFTGHGSGSAADRGGLVMNNPAGREAVTAEMLRDMLVADRMPGEVLMVFDSCHAGALSMSLDPLPNTRRESACSAAEQTFVGENSFTKRWVAAHRNMLNDQNDDGQVTTSEAFDKASADMTAAHGTHPSAGGDPSVEQKLHDDLGEAAKQFEQFIVGFLDALNPLRFFRPILNFFGFDPNEKTGPVGVGMENYVADAGTLNYTVYFENDPEFANAPAQVVTITDQLSTDLDWDTFQFGEVAFGENTFTLTGTQRLSTATVFDIKSGLIADVRAEFDPTTGLATWTFATIDPRTGERTIDPLAGFLPPNITSPEGEGHVAFSVRPRGSVTTGTAITNSATIVFDTNDPIITNEHVVTFDFDAPTSAIDPLPAAVPPSFMVSWTGTDPGSGVATFDIFVSDAGGPFILWLDDTTDMSARYAGQEGHSYAFFSVATDRVGRVEPAPAAADAQTTVPILPADFNQDLFVGLLDLVILQQNLGASGATLAMGDLNGDGVVNRTDAALFALHYARSAASPSPTAEAIIDRAVAELELDACCATPARRSHERPALRVGARQSRGTAGIDPAARLIEAQAETVAATSLETAITATRRRKDRPSDSPAAVRQSWPGIIGR